MKKILLVEDDNDIQKVYYEKLKNYGFEVFLSSNGIKGYEVAVENSPDIILLDILLPGQLNGFDLLSRLKGNEKLKSIPVVVISNIDKDKQEALDMGAVEYLLKAETELPSLIEVIEKYTSSSED